MIIWLVEYLPLKNMKVSWADYSQYMETIKNVPNHQAVINSQTPWPTQAVYNHWPSKRP